MKREKAFRRLVELERQGRRAYAHPAGNDEPRNRIWVEVCGMTVRFQDWYCMFGDFESPELASSWTHFFDDWKVVQY